MNDIYLTALQLAKEGISVVPVATDGTKKPAPFTWRKYQEEKPTTQELIDWFSQGTQQGVGAICGAVSGNLEMLELEGRAVAAQIHIQAKDMAENSGLGDLWGKIQDGYCEVTPSGGIHWLYRISDGLVPGNQKLARRPGENGGVDVLCETRGEGGFVILAPSGGACHPSGESWNILSGSIQTIPTITLAEREALFSIFKCFDEMPKIENIAQEVKSREINLSLPGDDYNSKVSWDQILTPLGWSKVYIKGEATAWRRPGKNEGISATTNFNGKDNLYVFTTSTIFESEHSYSKFAAYATLEHQGNFKAAASALRSQGYGKPIELNALPTQPTHSPSLVTLRDENEEPTTSTWLPEFINSDNIFDEPEPSILARADGHCIFYAGKINALFGESESGKTWVALEAVRQELDKGNTVFYLDFEDSVRGIYNRLNTLGADLRHFKTFLYSNPSEPLTQGAREALLTKIDQHRPSLIVLDGVNAAMNVMGLDLEKNKDATSFSQEVLRPMRLHNAAILTIDHVTKSKDNRGNYAIGAQAKRADIDGCAVAVDVEIAFGRGIDGALALKVTKDRPGFVRAICQEGKNLGVANIKALGTVNIKITIEGATVQMPSIEKKMEQVSEFMESHGVEMGLNEIAKRMRSEGIAVGNDNLKVILESLVNRRCLSVRKVGQKSIYKYEMQYLQNPLKNLPVDNFL
jgi:KaiC/GvpD/RAD55 family RecA-like ATPase